MDENRKPKFRLHWSQSVRFPDSPSYSSLLVDKLQKFKAPSPCAALIRLYDKPLRKALSVPRSGVSPHQSERYPNAGLDESKKEEDKAEVSSGSEEMRTKRKRALFTAGEAEAKKKKNKKEKVSLGNIVDLEMDKHLRGFEGEGRIASLWDRRFDFDGHVREHLFFCSDQDKLRRVGHVDVGGFVRANALRMAVAAEYLVEEVSRLKSELAKEMAGREKVERALARVRTESETLRELRAILSKTEADR